MFIYLFFYLNVTHSTVSTLAVDASLLHASGCNTSFKNRVECPLIRRQWLLDLISHDAEMRCVRSRTSDIANQSVLARIAESNHSLLYSNFFYVTVEMNQESTWFDSVSGQRFTYFYFRSLKWSAQFFWSIFHFDQNDWFVVMAMKRLRFLFQAPGPKRDSTARLASPRQITHDPVRHRYDYSRANRVRLTDTLWK